MSARCPSWCVTIDCNTDHWSEPGGERWPAVRATGWAQNDVPELIAHPVWGEMDGLAPTVGLWMTGKAIDHTIDMTPEEAIALAGHLTRAAETVTAG